jgi:hypothetical protein
VDGTVTISWAQLFAVLEDFRDWYEFEWLAEHWLDDGGMNAIDFYLQMRRKDPVWPDRPPDELYSL